MKLRLLSIACLLGFAPLTVLAQSGLPPANANKASVAGRPVSNTTMLGKSINAQINCDPEEDGDCPQDTTPAGPPPLVPQNPNGQEYEKPGKDMPGRIKIMVGTPRHFGYHIGDLMSVQIQIQTDDAVEMNFDLLKRGKFKASGTDSIFQLAKDDQGKPILPVILAQPSTRIPHTIDYSISMYVQDLHKLENTPYEVAFNLDLSYRIDPPADPKKRKEAKWNMLTTPDMVFSMTTLADNGKKLLDGDKSLAEIRTPWASYPLMALGFFILIWFGIGKDVVRWCNRIKVALAKPAEYVAWKEFKKVFADADEYHQFGPAFASKTSRALRRYFNIPSLAIDDIIAQHADDPKMPGVVDVLTKLNKVIYARVDQPVLLSKDEINSLKDAITALVPKNPAPKAKK